MPKDVEPFQPVEGSPPCEVALGCKVKAQGDWPRAFNEGAKPNLVTLRNHSPVESLDRKAGRRMEKALLRKRHVRPASVAPPKAMQRVCAP